MRKTLLATAAMAAVSLAVGFGGIAAAQSQMGNEFGQGLRRGAWDDARAEWRRPKRRVIKRQNCEPVGPPAGAKHRKKRQAE